MNERIERLRALLTLVNAKCSEVEAEGRSVRWQSLRLAREHDRLLGRCAAVAFALAEALTERQQTIDAETRDDASAL